MLTHLQNKIKALQAFSFKDELITIVEDNREKLADLQASQLAQGVNSKGQQINPQYRPFTVEQKLKYGVGLGRVVDRVTFFSSGDLYRSLSAQIAGTKFKISSPSFKFDKMIKRSGVDVVGLNIESRRDFIMEVTRPGILDAYDRKVRKVS